MAENVVNNPKAPGILRRNRMNALRPEPTPERTVGPMRKAIGVEDRDKVISKRTGQTARAGEVETVTMTFHQQEAETAKAELALIKAKLALVGLDIDSLPDSLPGASVPAEPETAEDVVAVDEKPAGKKAGK